MCPVMRWVLGWDRGDVGGGRGRGGGREGEGEGSLRSGGNLVAGDDVRRGVAFRMADVEAGAAAGAGFQPGSGAASGQEAAAVGGGGTSAVRAAGARLGYGNMSSA